MATKKQDYLENVAADLFSKYKVGEKTLVFELIHPKYGDHKHLKGKYQVTHNGQVYHFRYAPAFDTPFVKEQKSADSKDSGGIEVRGVAFRERRRVVPPTDPCLQKFLLLHPMCKLRGGKLFDIHDEDAKREERLALARLKRKAAQLIDKNYDANKLAPAAIVLQPENSSITRMNLEQLEEILTSYVEGSPQKVIDAFNNDEAKLLFDFNKAIAANVIRVDNENSKVTWAETGGKIFDIPQGVTAWRRWITFVNTSDGQIAYEAIKEQFDDK